MQGKQLHHNGIAEKILNRLKMKTVLLNGKYYQLLPTNGRVASIGTSRTIVFNASGHSLTRVAPQLMFLDRMGLSGSLNLKGVFVPIFPEQFLTIIFMIDAGSGRRTNLAVANQSTGILGYIEERLIRLCAPNAGFYFFILTLLSLMLAYYAHHWSVWLLFACLVMRGHYIWCLERNIRMLKIIIQSLVYQNHKL